jgi:hypothetical protein
MEAIFVKKMTCLKKKVMKAGEGVHKFRPRELKE